MSKINLFKEKNKKKAHNIMYYVSYLIYEQDYSNLNLKRLFNNNLGIKYVILLSDSSSYYISQMLANYLRKHSTFIFVYVYSSYYVMIDNNLNNKSTLCFFIYSTQKQIHNKCNNGSVSKCNVIHLFCPFILYHIVQQRTSCIFYLEALYFSLLFHKMNKNIKQINTFKQDMIMLPTQMEMINNLINFNKNVIRNKMDCKEVYIVTLDSDPSSCKWFAQQLKKRYKYITHVYVEKKIESSILHRLSCKTTLFILIHKDNSIQLSCELKKMYLILKKHNFEMLVISQSIEKDIETKDMLQLPQSIYCSYFTLLYVLNCILNVVECIDNNYIKN